eukprot:2562923-Prymnesium_polylepis.1
MAGAQRPFARPCARLLLLLQVGGQRARPLLVPTQQHVELLLDLGLLFGVARHEVFDQLQLLLRHLQPLRLARLREQPKLLKRRHVRQLRAHLLHRRLQLGRARRRWRR